MAEEGKGLALVILGIVALIAIVGLVLLFKGSATGNYVAESTFVQFSPQEACDRVGCPLKGIEGVTASYATQGPLMAVCACAGGDVRTPIVRQFDWRTEFYPQE
jgi:hypothetical protein